MSWSQGLDSFMVFLKDLVNFALQCIQSNGDIKLSNWYHI